MSEVKVLVVDDDDGVREIITRFLEFSDYVPIGASSGEEGLRQFAEHQPDLVISDILMPGMDGYKFCSNVRKGSDVPIILLSGQLNLETEQEKSKSLNIGVGAFMSKPLHMTEFLDIVANVLNGSHRNADSTLDRAPIAL